MIILKHIIFIFIALLCYPFVKLYAFFNPDHNIWLIGENAGECLHDNGYFFFKFCTENTSENVFFVISRNSINYDDYLKKSKRALHYGSVKHVIFFLLATTCFFTHTYRDIAYKKIFIFFRKDIIKVFLQHGVLGFGDITKWYNLHLGKVHPDLFIISTPHEKIILQDYFSKLPRATMSLTGLARYDWLQENESKGTNKSILYIPTSRDWAIANYQESLYFNKVKSLLYNTDLENLLVKFNVTFKCYLHKKMRQCLGDLHPESHIEIIKPGKTTVHELIKSSSLMITDYSSVSWDFFYLKKPVIFYQFDQEEYLQRQGSYVDYQDFLFGEIVIGEDELLSIIVNYCYNGFKELDIHSEKRNGYFEYFDQKNCQRIYVATLKLSS